MTLTEIVTKTVTVSLTLTVTGVAVSSDNEREETEAAVVTDTVENLSNGSFRGDGDRSGRGKLGPM